MKFLGVLLSFVVCGSAAASQHFTVALNAASDTPGTIEVYNDLSGLGAHSVYIVVATSDKSTIKTPGGGSTFTLGGTLLTQNAGVPDPQWVDEAGGVSYLALSVNDLSNNGDNLAENDWGAWVSANFTDGAAIDLPSDLSAPASSSLPDTGLSLAQYVGAFVAFLGALVGLVAAGFFAYLVLLLIVQRWGGGVG